MLLQLGIIVLAIWILYYRSISYGYIIDDIDVVPRPKDGTQFKSQEEYNLFVKDNTTKDKFKFFCEHLFGRKYTNSKFAHSLNIIIHTLNCTLIYFFLGHNTLAFITTFLFALNPVNNQVTLWLSGKNYGMACTLILTGLVWLPLLPLVYALALMVTASPVFLPFIFLIKQPYWVLPILLLIAYLSRKRFTATIKERYKGATDGMVKINPYKFMVMFKTLGYYICLCLFPIKLGMFHEYLHTYALDNEDQKKWHKIDAYFIIGILTALSALSVFFYKSPITFGLFWFVLFTIQWCNLVILNHPVSERYIYISNIGLMYALASLISFTPFVYIFLTFYAVRLFYFMPAYRDVETFWTSNIDNFPTVVAAYNQLGLAEYFKGLHGTAIDVWMQGHTQRPQDFRLNYNIANFFISRGNMEPARQYLKKAEEVVDKKNNYDFWIGQIQNLKNAYKQRGLEWQ